MPALLRLVFALSLLHGQVPLWAAEEPEPVDELIARGESQLQQNDIDAAIETLRRAVAAHPDSSLARTRLGGAYLLAQDYDGAIGQFQRAIGADPENAAAFIGMGLAYLHSARPGPARAALTEAKRIDPTRRAEIDAVLRGLEPNDAMPRGPHGQELR
jgi:tetratricopeptide (TPR) repeat protein